MYTVRLKNFDAEQNSLDELIELAAFGKTIAATYADNSIPVPEWLETSLSAVNVEIKRRNQDYLAKELKETEAALAALKTREEKKTELAERQAKLKAALGQI